MVLRSAIAMMVHFAIAIEPIAFEEIEFINFATLARAIITCTY